METIYKIVATILVGATLLSIGTDLVKWTVKGEYDGTAAGFLEKLLASIAKIPVAVIAMLFNLAGNIVFAVLSAVLSIFKIEPLHFTGVPIEF